MPHALDELQRRISHWISTPDGVAAALGAGGEAHEDLARLLRADRGRSPAERLGVYVNAYFSRIHDVLADDYPALRGVTGDAGFRELVARYLAVHPSTRPSLRHAGARLADFLSDDAAAAPARERWPFAADLARLEWAMTDVFDAADARPLSRDALAALPPERWAGLRLAPIPALQVLRLAWPVHRLKSAADAGEPLPEIAAVPTRLCVWRQDERIFHRAIDPLEDACLALAAEGAAFGEVCERIEAAIGEAQTPARAVALLARWARDGLIEAREE